MMITVVSSGDKDSSVKINKIDKLLTLRTMINDGIARKVRKR